MRIKLQHRLILSYFALALFIIGLISILINFSVKKGFENYIIEEHQSLVGDLHHNIEMAFKDNAFDINSIEQLGISSIEKGLIITVTDLDNQIIWSAMEHNAGLCETMIANVKENMFSQYTNWNGNYTEDIYPLVVENQQIGRLKVGYLGPFYFNEEELYFLTSINHLLIIVGVSSMLLSIVVGLLMSHSLTKPIATVIHHLNNMHDPHSDLAQYQLQKTVELNALYQAAYSLETRITEQEQLRKQLTQDMAHELKTPLTSIQGQLEAMIDGIFEISTDRLESCHDEIIRIKSLIADIESLSIIENENTQLNIETFDFEQSLVAITKTFDLDFTEKDIQLVLKKGTNYKEKAYQQFYGDSDKLKQVMVNLVSNTIKYAGTHVTITITLDMASTNYVISYEDNGPGISKKDRPFVFHRFYRADPSRTGHNGLGIGLTMVKSIIEKHHGTITLDETFDSGARFIIRLPGVNRN